VTGADTGSALALVACESLVALPSRATGASSATSGTGFSQNLAALASAAVGSDAGSTGGPTGADVVADARRYLGVPYVLGGTTAAGGMDCSGLVQTVFKDLGVTDVARGVHGQMTQGEPVASLADARPGDEITIEVLRDGKRMEFEVKLGERPLGVAR